MYNFAIGGPSQAGIPLCAINTYEQYVNKSNYIFISKGTLENVLTERIGSIDTVLEALTVGGGVS